MAGSTTTEMRPGQIISAEGASLFRQMLRSGRALRCADLWMASGQPHSGDSAEIEIYCSFDPRTDRWAAEIYYDSFEHAVEALREYERTGNMPEGE